MSASSGLQSTATPWPLSSTMAPLDALPTAPAYARAYVLSLLADWRMTELAESLELITSELVTNAVSASIHEFGCPPYRDGHMAVVCVRLLANRVCLRIEVWDMAVSLPVARQATADDEAGRGLTLVETLTDRWGWLSNPDSRGKCVWAQLRL